MSSAKQLLMQPSAFDNLVYKHKFTQIGPNVWVINATNRCNVPSKLTIILTNLGGTINLEITVIKKATKTSIPERKWTCVRSDFSIDTADRIISALLHHNFWDIHDLLSFLNDFDFRVR